MKRKNHIILQIVLFIFIILSDANSQVSINNSLDPPDASAMLDVKSSDKGILIPRMTEIARNNISNPSNALLIFQTDGQSGFYYNSGTSVSPVWISLSSQSGGTPIRIPIDTLPFTISTSGSYYVTETLMAPTGENGITITASNVSIDMNGNGLLSDGSGTHAGIASSGSISQISIYNGSLSNWGGHGIFLTSASSISLDQIKVSTCGYSGFNSGIETVINNCHASNNGLDGISVNNSSIVMNCTATNNGSDGIDVNNYCSVLNCQSKTNSGNGIETSATCQVANSISHDNGDNGFYLSSGSTISNCIASSNTLSGIELLTGGKADGNQSRSNDGNGFTSANDATLTNNSADNNGLSGFLSDGNDARLDNNQSTDNSQHGISVTGSGNVIMRNTCSGNVSTAFSIAVGNTSGTVLTSATFNSNTNPFANIAF